MYCRMCLSSPPSPPTTTTVDINIPWLQICTFYVVYWGLWLAAVYLWYQLVNIRALAILLVVLCLYPFLDSVILVRVWEEQSVWLA